MRLSKAVPAALGAAALLKLLMRESIDLHGRVVLITGGSRGLGLVLARQFGAAGAKLAICARNEAEVGRAHEELVGKGYDVVAMRCDVSDPDEARRFVERVVLQYGRLDVIVNNAGIIQIGPIESMGLNEFQEAMDAIFWSTVNVTLASLPYLKRQQGSRIVDISSIGGAIAVPHLLPYSAAKFAVVGFSAGLRTELAKDGIRVVTILPGLMRTGSFLNAYVRGQQEQETQWFSLGASLPGISINAERAAARIVKACIRGEGFVTLGLPARIARLVTAVAPNVVLTILAVVAKMLPKPTGLGTAQRSEPAREHRAGVASSLLTMLGDRAADWNNERPMNPGELH